MKHLVKTSLTVPEAVEAITAALADRKFGVLHVHDLKATLNSKGVPFATECRVLEVCNPQQAARVLGDDIDMNMALPCRVSVYEKDGATIVGTVSPKAMLGTLSDSPALAGVAEEVESVIYEAMDAIPD
jgi:uncharacterized protein (DUF302 family)